MFLTNYSWCAGKHHQWAWVHWGVSVAQLHSQPCPKAVPCHSHLLLATGKGEGDLLPSDVTWIRGYRCYREGQRFVGCVLAFLCAAPVSPCPDPVDFLAHLAADTSCFMGHGYFFFFKSILGKCPVYLCTLLCPSYTRRSYASWNGWFFDEFGQIWEICIFLLHSLDMELLNHASISKIKSRCGVKETCRCFFWEAT